MGERYTQLSDSNFHINTVHFFGNWCYILLRWLYACIQLQPLISIHWLSTLKLNVNIHCYYFLSVKFYIACFQYHIKLDWHAPIWWNFLQSSRFLGAIKQYLCLSLLKNSASAHLIVFQLSCSIFMSLVSRFRPGLKAEIGVFFPMIVLRVLENVAQPIFQQKMIVLRFLEKLCVDSQILVDIFINYDCDVHSSNIFERYVFFILMCLAHKLTLAEYNHKQMTICICFPFSLFC